MVAQVGIKGMLGLFQEKEKKKKESGLLWWFSGKESTCQCRRHVFNPWFGRITQAAEQLKSYTAAIETVL